jgi:hypothetical protein
VKRFTVDAGHYFDRIDSTFNFQGAPLTVAVGLNKSPADKGEDETISFDRRGGEHALVQWVAQKRDGDFGVAVIVPSSSQYAADKHNEMMLARASAGQPLRYYVGAAWTRVGEITSRDQWERYVADESARVAAPVKISLSAQ